MERDRGRREAGGPLLHYNELQPAFSWGVYGSRTLLTIDKWK